MFRIAIEEKEGSQDLAFAGYVDGERVCYTTPHPGWQNAISERTLFFIALNTYSNQSWDQESEYVALFDDIAVYPMGE